MKTGIDLLLCNLLNKLLRTVDICCDTSVKHFIDEIVYYRRKKHTGV